jgi:hypothetical protein
MTPLSSAANMHSLHPEAFYSRPLRAVRFCALANPYGYYRRLFCSRCGAHTSTFLPPVPRRSFAFCASYGLWPLRYHEGSDSCTAHLPCRSPRLPRHTFLSFRLQPRGLPDHRLPPRQRDQRVSDFAMSEQARRSFPPNRVRSPTDRQFASGCSPPRFAATQLPSATELWLSPAWTSTMLMWRPHGRTHPGENRGPAPNLDTVFQRYDGRCPSPYAGRSLS